MKWKRDTKWAFKLLFVAVSLLNPIPEEHFQVTLITQLIASKQLKPAPVWFFKQIHRNYPVSPIVRKAFPWLCEGRSSALFNWLTDRQTKAE